MSLFADSSALVTLYAEEPGRTQLSRRERRSTGIVVSQLARVEVPAALWRKERTGELDAADAATLVAEFEADYFGTDDEPPRFGVVRVGAELLDVASRLCASHGLRAYDAVQLASALAALAADPELGEFAAYDAALRRAALAEGFVLVD